MMGKMLAHYHILKQLGHGGMGEVYLAEDLTLKRSQGGIGMHSSNEQVIFADDFGGTLDEGWSWLRENPDAWRLRDGGLEIRVEPGMAETVRNALVRPAPDRREGTWAIEVTITNHTQPTQQYEQAGITWYTDGKPVFKAVKELIDGALYIIPGRQPMPAQRVRLRLLVTAESWEAQYCPGEDTEFRAAATGTLPPPGDDQVSLQCYNGPPDAEHWIRFEHFCITRSS